MCVVLRILDEIAPGPNLCAHVAELRNDREKKLRISKQTPIPSIAIRLSGRVLVCNGRKLNSENRVRPYQDDNTQYHVGRKDSLCFMPQEGIVYSMGFHPCDLGRPGFNSGKDKQRTNHRSTDRSNGIERLRKVQPSYETCPITRPNTDETRLARQYGRARSLDAGAPVSSIHRMPAGSPVAC